MADSHSSLRLVSFQIVVCALHFVKDDIIREVIYISYQMDLSKKFPLKLGLNQAVYFHHFPKYISKKVPVPKRSPAERSQAPIAHNDHLNELFEESDMLNDFDDDGAPREECSCAESEEGGKPEDDAIGCEECGGRRPKPTVGGVCTNGKPIGDSGCTAGEEEGWLEAIGECKCGEGGGIEEAPAPTDARTAKETTSCVKRYTAGSNNSDNSHDCGYSSENNNGCCDTGSLVSSLSSSPAGSELACSEACCHHDDYVSSHYEDDETCFITPEEVREFESNSRQVNEKRLELREMLQKRFAQFCVNGPVPRFLFQTKYASN
nr:unnamed protein product [Callosobruchus analis]